MWQIKFICHISNISQGNNMIPDQQESFESHKPEDVANILNKHLDLVKNYGNEIGWLLEQNANLRSEYVTFFKKDLKEIESALQNLTGDEEKGKDFLNQIISDFRKDLERSYELLNFTFFWKLAKALDAGEYENE